MLYTTHLYEESLLAEIQMLIGRPVFLIAKYGDLV